MLENVKLVAGIIILVLYWGTVPSVIGIAGSSVLCRKKKVSVVESYILGNIIIWAIFQVLCVLMGFMGSSFTVLTVIFTVIILVLLIVSLGLQARGIKEKIWNLVRKVTRFRWGEWLIIALILVQVGSLVFGMSYSGANGDDAAYIAISLDALEQNSIGKINYYTGLPTGVPLKILLTSWNYYISFLSKISGVHVAIIAHTFLPIVLVPMAYMVYLLIAGELFQHKRKKVVAFLLWINLLIIFGGYSWYTLTFRLDVCVWQGKAVMATIMLPFLFYYLLRTNEYQKRDFMCLLFILISTCAMSLMGVGLSIIIVTGVIVARFQRSYIRKIFPLLMAIGIVSVTAIFYFFRMSSLNNFSYESIKELFPKSVDMMLGAYRLYWNETRVRWLYYLGLVYLLFKQRKNKQSKFLSKYITWQYVIIFNPIVYYIAYMFLKEANVYVRLYYILFPEICMAYVLTTLMFELKKKWSGIIYALICGAFIIGNGKTYQEIAWFYKTPNLYKMPQETIELCDMINVDSIEKKPRVIVSDAIVVYIRQYSSRIQMLYGRYGYSYNGHNILDLIRDDKITIEEIVQLMKKNDCQYLIWKNDLSDIEELESLGGNIVGNTQNYVVVRMDFEAGN